MIPPANITRCTKCKTIRYTTAPTINNGAANIANSIDFSYQIVASPYITSYGASGLPSGLSVNAATGVIFGTVTGQTLGATITCGISATNAKGTANGTLTLKVKQGVTINFSAFTNGGGAYDLSSFQLSLDGGGFFQPSASTDYKAVNQISFKTTPNPNYNGSLIIGGANLTFESGAATLKSGSSFNEVGTVSVTGTLAFCQIGSPNLALDATGGTNYSSIQATTTIGSYSHTLDLTGTNLTNSSTIVQTFEGGGLLNSGSFQETVLNF